jgi:acetyltransferase-like isoleucine patch superfamily enzyme
MPTIHPLADVQSPHIGEGTRIWQFCVVLPDARIGSECNICAGVLIENDVVIGDRVTIKCGIQICDGVRIADDVFIGPNVGFTNDPFPRSRQYPEKFSMTIVQHGASIGANGAGAMIGAGSVVTKDIPENELWLGNPARFHRKL